MSGYKRHVGFPGIFGILSGTSLVLLICICTELGSGVNGEKTKVSFQNEASASTSLEKGSGLENATAVVSKSKELEAGLGGAVRVDEEMGRVKRQERNAVVVGLSVMRGAQAEDYNRIKPAAGRVVRAARSRRHINVHNSVSVGEHAAKSVFRLPHKILYGIHKGWRRRPPHPPRPVHIHEYHEHQIFVPIHIPVPVVPATLPPATTTASPFITNTQRIFNTINFNLSLASNLREEYLREFNTSVLPASAAAGVRVDPLRIEAVSRLLVINPAGVTCVDVCNSTQRDGIGYGTIGICTRNFCQCDFNVWQFTRFDCPPSSVFDPILLTCNNPRNVVLCNDDEYVEPTHPPTTGYYGGYPSFGYEHWPSSSSSLSGISNNISLTTRIPASTAFIPSASPTPSLHVNSPSASTFTKFDNSAVPTPSHYGFTSPTPNTFTPQQQQQGLSGQIFSGSTSPPFTPFSGPKTNKALGSPPIPTLSLVDTPPESSAGYNNQFNPQQDQQSDITGQITPQQWKQFSQLLAQHAASLSNNYNNNIKGNAPTLDYGPPSSSYGPPQSQQTTSYGPPQSQQTTSYGPPTSQQTLAYGPPNSQQTTSYGPPTSQQTLAYGPPNTQQTQSYGPPGSQQQQQQQTLSNISPEQPGTIEVYPSQNFEFSLAPQYGGASPPPRGYVQYGPPNHQPSPVIHAQTTTSFSQIHVPHSPAPQQLRASHPAPVPVITHGPTVVHAGSFRPAISQLTVHSPAHAGPVAMSSSYLKQSGGDLTPEQIAQLNQLVQIFSHNNRIRGSHHHVVNHQLSSQHTAQSHL